MSVESRDDRHTCARNMFIRFLFLCATCSKHRPCQVVPVHNKLGLQLDQHTDVKVLFGVKNVVSAGISTHRWLLVQFETLFAIFKGITKKSNS